MKFSRSFKFGGLSVDLRRNGGDHDAVQNAYLPATATVLLKQHEGAAAHCLVRRGELVREGALIGRADGPGQAAIHAPLPGVVYDIRRVRLPSGGDCEAVVIALEGSFDRLGKREERYLWKSMSRIDILQTLRDRGIAETEQPARPLFEVLRPEKRFSTLVLNALESEPYLQSETMLLAGRIGEVLEGFAILRTATQATQCFLALDATLPELAARVEEAAARLTPTPASIRLEPRYPQDMPERLSEALADKRRDAEGETLFVRPTTAFAVYEAVVLAKPFLERYVTIAGGAVKRPAVLKVRIGTPIGDLIEECGGFVGSPERIVLGGPFRGVAVYDLDAPVTKQTSAVLALSAEETQARRRMPCIRCGRCAERCPERLDPAHLYRLVSAGRFEAARAAGLESCSSCGLCGYVCPSRLTVSEALASARDATVKRGKSA